LEIKNSRAFIAKLEDDMKNSVHVVDAIKSKRGYPYFNIINYRGLIRILNTSRTEKRKEFQKCS